MSTNSEHTRVQVNANNTYQLDDSPYTQYKSAKGKLRATEFTDHFDGLFEKILILGKC